MVEIGAVVGRGNSEGEHIIGVEHGKGVPTYLPVDLCERWLSEGGKPRSVWLSFVIDVDKYELVYHVSDLGGKLQEWEVADRLES